MEGQVKWSRNLSANQSEISRMRQITKQKMEIKRNKHQQPMVTSTRQQSARTIKSAIQRKTELNNSSDESINSPSDNLSIEEDKDKIIDQFKDNFNNNEKIISTNKAQNNNEIKQSSNKKSISSTSCISQTHSAEEDNIDESSEDDTPIKSTRKIEKSKSTFNLSDYKDKKINQLNNNLDNITVLSNKTKDINPLKTLLNNSELLEFVINPVPRNSTYQCTIIRDKKGLDRSLYPTYYMHLQTINSKDDNQQLKVEDFKDNSSNETNGNLLNGTKNNGHLKNETNNESNNEHHNRQVFLLSGRRRKKSKTYLISCNPFEITRLNCIAKTKSNVIGTQFNTIRILQNNQRLDYATIIYDTNVLGFKGPRKMTVLLPKIESSNYYKQISLNSEITLTDLNRIDPKSVIKLKNKTPVWNEETQSYVLNFKGRVTKASVKNFQLEQCDLTDELGSKEDIIENQNSQSTVSDQQSTSNSVQRSKNSSFISNDFISMQFGRISNSDFTCDVSYPLSLLQAFSIALSSFDSKLACE